MKAVFLCAGYGTRLYPLTKDRPKALLLIAGEVLLTHLFRKVEQIKGIEQVILVSNALFYHQFCQWKKTLKTSLDILVINDGTTDNEHRLGAIPDLELALKEGRSNTDILVLAGDNLFDSNLTSFVSFASQKSPGASLGVYDVHDRELAQKYGLIKANSSGKITAFFEKPKDPPTTLASMGVYYFPKETLGYINRYLETNRNPDAPGYYVSWLAKEIEVYAFPFTGTWFDIGDLNSYHQADQHFQFSRKERTT